MIPLPSSSASEKYNLVGDTNPNVLVAVSGRVVRVCTYLLHETSVSGRSCALRAFGWNGLLLGGANFRCFFRSLLLRGRLRAVYGSVNFALALPARARRIQLENEFPANGCEGSTNSL